MTFVTEEQILNFQTAISYLRFLGYLLNTDNSAEYSNLFTVSDFPIVQNYDDRLLETRAFYKQLPVGSFMEESIASLSVIPPEIDISITENDVFTLDKLMIYLNALKDCLYVRTAWPDEVVQTNGNNLNSYMKWGYLENATVPGDLPLPADWMTTTINDLIALYNADTWHYNHINRSYATRALLHCKMDAISGNRYSILSFTRQNYRYLRPLYLPNGTLVLCFYRGIAPFEDKYISFSPDDPFKTKNLFKYFREIELNGDPSSLQWTLPPEITIETMAMSNFENPEAAELMYGELAVDCIFIKSDSLIEIITEVPTP